MRTPSRTLHYMIYSASINAYEITTGDLDTTQKQKVSFIILFYLLFTKNDLHVVLGSIIVLSIIYYLNIFYLIYLQVMSPSITLTLSLRQK